MRRLIALASLLAVSALLGPACAIALGVQDDTYVASTVICSCEPFQSSLPDCQSVLEARITGATPDVRSKWLQDFGKNCMASCPDVFACFYEAPTCQATGSPCKQPLECCSYFPNNDLTVCQANGTCK